MQVKSPVVSAVAVISVGGGMAALLDTTSLIAVCAGRRRKKAGLRRGVKADPVAFRAAEILPCRPMKFYRLKQKIA